MPTLADKLARAEARAVREQMERRGGAGSAVADAPRTLEAAPALRDVPAQALSNLGESAAKYGSDIWNAITNPVETGEALLHTMGGGVQLLKDELGIPATGTFGDQRPRARALGQHFADRYGSWGDIKQTAATDPVGFLADAAAPLTLGGGAVASAPGMAGRAARIASALDPAVAAQKAVTGTAKGLGKAATGVLGMTTGTGPKAVAAAARSGAEGGVLGQKFRQAMRGEVPIDAVVDEARSAVQNLYQQRGAAYRQNMAAVKQDPTVLDFGKIDKAIADSAGVKTFKGVDLSPSTADTRGQITKVINDWKARDPAEFHTVEGIDALKQIVGDIKDAAKYGTPEWKVANSAYNAIRGTITDQAPGYAKVMKDYTQASKLLEEMQRELSLGPKGNPATALRKLQAIIRDDVSSAYGRRGELAAQLERGGMRGLEETMAGQAMTSALPRGLRGNVAAATGLGTIGGVGAMGGGPAAIPAAAAYALASSPRVVGEAAHLAGRVGGPVIQGTGAALPSASRGAALSYQANRQRELAEAMMGR